MNVSSHPYTDAPSNQLQLQFEGMSQEGYELMQNARTWAARHYHEWMYFKRMAREMTERKGYARANRCIEDMRDQFMCKVPNAYAPAFARIAMEQDPRIKFKCGKSKTDGFTTAVLK